ncbi:MAG: hypothetical protein P4L35_10690 [Ignavibacteriaceae bacterium]|nr:hypothetical protein [Ignavibacteriaceae bacterium]
MAIYRQVQTTFWQDEFVLNLTPEEKYFYLFLLTNSKTKQCGIYQLPVQVIVFETGYNQETVEKLLHRFIDYGKIIYSTKTREIGILNWHKYNPAESPKVKACVVKELKEIKDRSLIDKLYPMDRVSQEEQEQAKEKEKKPAEEEREVPSVAAAALSTFLSNQTICHFREGADLITDINNNDDYDYNCQSLTDQSAMLFSRIWNQPNKNPEEYRLVSEYIIKYGFTAVEFAFREAVKYNSRKLAYVEAICKKRKEKIAVNKSIEEAKQKKREQYKDLTPEERKSWSNLHLLDMVYSNKSK